MHECALYEEPELYDLLFPNAAQANYIDDEPRERRLATAEQFYLEEAKSRGGRVLELGCGSGRLTIPLARAELDIVGIDISESMLAYARKKASAANVNVEFQLADMRDFDLHEKFSTIFVAGNSLLHLLDNANLQRCLSCVRRHLSRDGRLVFDVFNPNVRLLARDPAKRYPVMRVKDTKRGEISVEEMPSYDAATQVNHVTWYLSSPGAPDFRVIGFRLRAIFPQELLWLLPNAGFRLLARYGEFTREPFESTSPRQVCICAPA